MNRMSRTNTTYLDLQTILQPFPRPLLWPFYIILSDSTLVDLRTTRRRSRCLRSCGASHPEKQPFAVFNGISLPGRSRSRRRRSSSHGSPNDRRRKMKENKESKEKPNREVKEPDGKVSPIPEKVAVDPAPEVAAGAPQVT